MKLASLISKNILPIIIKNLLMKYQFSQSFSQSLFPNVNSRPPKLVITKKMREIQLKKYKEETFPCPHPSFPSSLISLSFCCHWRPQNDFFPCFFFVFMKASDLVFHHHFACQQEFMINAHFHSFSLVDASWKLKFLVDLQVVVCKLSGNCVKIVISPCL